MAVQISNAQLEIMQVIWEQNRPLTFQEICGLLHKVTIQPQISRLGAKGDLDALRQFWDAEMGDE